MSEVVVVTDSSTCLPAELIEKYAIQMLPISVNLGDGVEAEVDSENSTSNWRLPTSVEEEERAGANHPFVTEYLEAIERPGYRVAVVITPAIEFATMFRNASLAAELASRPTITIDTRTAAAGQALVVLAGAEAAAKGADLDEVVRVVNDAAARVELVASLATLEPMRQSGPLPEAVLGAAQRFGMRSVFRMANGSVEPLGSDASLDDSLATIRNTYAKSAVHGIERSTVFHADVPELAERLAVMLESIDFVSGFSLAMQVHTGRGVVGAAWIPRMPHS